MSVRVIAFVALLSSRIIKKDTPDNLRIKLPTSTRLKMNKTNTTKNPRQKGISGISHRKKLKRNLEVEDTRGHTVNKVSRGKNILLPKRLRNVHGKQESRQPQGGGHSCVQQLHFVQEC
ncbi:hypothetical protein CsSME_00024629 [Camellia sinensis var. sinensis]